MEGIEREWDQIGSRWGQKYYPIQGEVVDGKVSTITIANIECRLRPSLTALSSRWGQMYTTLEVFGDSVTTNSVVRIDCRLQPPVTALSSRWGQMCTTLEVIEYRLMFVVTSMMKVGAWSSL